MAKPHGCFFPAGIESRKKYLHTHEQSGLRTVAPWWPHTGMFQMPLGEGLNVDNEGVNSQFHLITQEPGQNARMLAEKTGKSLSTIEREIRRLKAEGKIAFRGAPKNGGYYHPLRLAYGTQGRT